MTEVAGNQSVGARDNQEDAFRIIFEDQETNSGAFLMLLADGMGGHAGGEIASNIALDAFARRFVGKANSPRAQQRLRDALAEGNEAIRQRTAQEHRLRGMGCTLLAALRIEDRLVWLSVGDSILFLYRKGQLRRLNADHSLYGELVEMVKAGKMSREEADRHPNRNALRSAVTGDKITLVDVNAIRLEPGDVVLLATDGLESLTDAQIEELLGRTETRDTSSKIAELLAAVDALKRPKQDNTTLVMHRVARSGAPLGSATSWSEDPSYGAKVAKKTKITMGLVGAGAAVLLGMLIWLVAFQGTDEPAPVAATPAGLAAPDSAPAPESGAGIGETDDAQIDWPSGTAPDDPEMTEPADTPAQGTDADPAIGEPPEQAESDPGGDGINAPDMQEPAAEVDGTQDADVPAGSP